MSGRLRRRGIVLECLTLGWNVAGVAVLAVTAFVARSVALAGFGLDSLVEIGASIVVIWELTGASEAKQRRALRLIRYGFVSLAAYLIVQSTWALAVAHRAGHSAAGIGWTAATAATMFALAAAKVTTGTALDDPVLRAEGRMTLVDGLLAVAVLAGLALNFAWNWWWADPVAGYLLAGYAARTVWSREA